MFCNRMPRETAILTAIALILALLLAWNLMTPERGMLPAFQAHMERVRLVSDMRLNLAAAEEAEKGAVLADTDEASQTLARESEASSQAVESDRAALEALLAKEGNSRQKGLILQFSRAFGELRQIDREILDLAVRNTNLKASSMAFGPAAQALEECKRNLSALAEANLSSPLAQDVLLLTSKAEIGLLTVQTLLAPHIMEALDAKMDILEAEMSRQQAEAAQALDALAALDPLEGRNFLDKARAAFGRYQELKTRILALSRENTNVRSIVLSLSRKRKILATCQEVLASLEVELRNQDVDKATR